MCREEQQRRGEDGHGDYVDRSHEKKQNRRAGASHQLGANRQDPHFGQLPVVCHQADVDARREGEEDGRQQHHQQEDVLLVLALVPPGCCHFGWAMSLSHKLTEDNHFDAKRQPQEEQRKLSTLGQSSDERHKPRTRGSLCRLGAVRRVLHSSTKRDAAAFVAAPVGQRRRGRRCPCRAKLDGATRRRFGCTPLGSTWARGGSLDQLVEHVASSEPADCDLDADVGADDKVEKSMQLRHDERRRF